MTIIDLVEAVAAETINYSEAMEVLDTLNLSEQQWTDAEIAIRMATPFMSDS